MMTAKSCERDLWG